MQVDGRPFRGELICSVPWRRSTSRQQSAGPFRVGALSLCRTTLQEQSEYAFHAPTLREREANSWVKDVAALKMAGLIAVQVDESGYPLGAQATGRGLVRYASRSTESALVFTQFIPDLIGDTFDTKACDVQIDAETKPIVKTLMNEFRKQNNARVDRTAAKPSSSSLHVRFVMRSTQSMLYFLGELNRANLAGQAPLTIPVRGNRMVRLFEARCCDALPDAAVSVEYRSNRYSVKAIPAAADKAPDDDRSLQTLALLSLVYGLQNQSSEAPAIRNVRVIP
jgi:hypothetical protein